MKTCLIIKGRYDYKEMVIQVKNTSFEEKKRVQIGFPGKVLSMPPYS